MTSPRRLLDSAKNAHARALLRAGVEDGPKPEALRAAALSLGVGASLTLASTATATVVGTAAAAAPSLPLIAAKWIAIGALGGLALASGGSAVSNWGRPQQAPIVVSPQPPSVVVVAAPDVPRAVSLPAPPLVDAQNSALPPKPALPASPPRAANVASSAPAPLARPDLAREVRQIDGARARLAAGDAHGARALLDEYAAAVRTGTLDREAQLLRIDALWQGGEQVRSTALARQYLERFPKDPHAARLRELIGDRSMSP